ncbi:flagellar type III secretion system protein FlhB [Ancylobacter dichloromethanicus]|uniref:Flagellar biosynthesis protein FlhB n=1 Tax=Ancylobacter dichloromethanicus TaxID=518825 RepID=A0A9W6J6F0_9HYPH|nr:EscU/YscU/HrcU family type III secretion system export apparatus switch protein [Ancylobacter dichloromethanicus]MBS7556307.1 flagellar type III secretion system protein FlhB [Ancylobacter dichloromethanicus]GLK70070.1 flagellar biosynthesis protein FlhB [Ancylobacter dichloromethanicus]
MSEDNDKDSKTEEASEKKISDALEKGNVPFSREATLFASLVGILVSLSLFAGPQASLLSGGLSRFLDDPGGVRLFSGEDAVALFWTAFTLAARFLLPIVVVLAAGGLVASLMQNQPRMVGERIRPQWSRVSPAAGWKRIFGKRGHVEFGKSVFKFAAISLICVLLLMSAKDSIIGAMSSEPNQIPSLLLGLAVRLVSAICVATIALVCIDLVWSRLSWRSELRMTKQEVKEEFKQAEGDPIVKARLRSLAKERARHRMMNAVPRASLVIANPTHYAIALYYDRVKGGAPLVLAKGADLIALKIRAIAESHGVPVIEDRALARAMYDAIEVDQWIPQGFYRPVAKILYFLYARGPDAGK